LAKSRVGGCRCAGSGGGTAAAVAVEYRRKREGKSTRRCSEGKETRILAAKLCVRDKCAPCGEISDVLRCYQCGSRFESAWCSVLDHSDLEVMKVCRRRNVMKPWPTRVKTTQFQTGLYATRASRQAGRQAGCSRGRCHSPTNRMVSLPQIATGEARPPVPAVTFASDYVKCGCLAKQMLSLSRDFTSQWITSGWSWP
jgi:hypothetical protein